MSTTLVITTACEVDYNLLHTNIDSYRSEVIFAADGITPIGLRVSISGSAMMVDTNWGTLRDEIRLSAGKIESAILGIDGANLIDVRRTTSLKGAPTATITGNAVHGTGLALINFEITDETSECGQPVVAHTWTQEMRLDAAGRATRTVHGQIVINRRSTNTDYTPATTPTTWGSKGAYADLFRRAFIPQPPSEGWRRESQQFAYSEASNVLLYQLVDVQHAYDLPDGVRVGDMEFSIERTAREAGIANATFTCDLEGDLSLKQADMSGAGVAGLTGNRLLVQAAIALSKTRINANYGSIIITRMRITEQEILSRHKIRFELDAQVVSSSTTSSVTVSPLMTMVGQKFTVVRSLQRAVDPYGPNSINTTISGENPQASGSPYTYWMVPHYVSSSIQGQCCTGSNTASLPQLTVMTGSNAWGTIEVGVTAQDMPATVTSEFDGKLATKQSQPEADSDGFTQIIGHSLTHTAVGVDGGMVRLSSAYQTSADLVFQTMKPRVRVTERIEVAQVNKAPSRVMRPYPSGAMIISENWDVSASRNDAQGQGLFTGVYERVYELFDKGNAISSNGFTADGNFRSWGAPNGYVAGTLSPVMTDASQETSVSVFGPFVGADPTTGITSTERYPVTTSDWYKP